MPPIALGFSPANSLHSVPPVNRYANPACRIWARFPRDDKVMAVDNVPVPRSGIVSGGPIVHDFVALEGDELLVGTSNSPARLLGYRVIHKRADPELEAINSLRQDRAAEESRVNAMVGSPMTLFLSCDVFGGGGGGEVIADCSVCLLSLPIAGNAAFDRRCHREHGLGHVDRRH